MDDLDRLILIGEATVDQLITELAKRSSHILVLMAGFAGNPSKCIQAISGSRTFVRGMTEEALDELRMQSMAASELDDEEQEGECEA